MRYAMVGLSYGIALGVLGLVPAGAGHGTYGFLLIALEPVPLLFWPLIFFLASRLDLPHAIHARVWICLLMALHYFGLAALWQKHSQDEESFRQAFKTHGSVLAVYAVAYVIPQVWLWGRFLLSFKKHQPERKTLP